MRFGDGSDRRSERSSVDVYFDVPSVRDLLVRCGACPSDIVAIREVLVLEWAFFDQVEGLDGRAACQDDARSFFIHRLAQYLALPFAFAHLVLHDLKRLGAADRNPVVEKYARMMAATDPDRFREVWAHTLPAVSPVRACALREVELALAAFAREAVEASPKVAAHARVESSMPRHVSAVDYMLGEVAPYSLRTIWLLRDELDEMARSDVNPILDAFAYACAIDRLPGV
ncbi:MAG: DUF4125 family protein [Collinsella sp.]|nr:DUF4125 family protein [Collinsella sp.]